MAKSKSFFGLRRGSTKSLTFSVYEGKQVTKDRVTEVKNPRTPTQMEQRMHMASALAVYSACKEIFDHSFQGVTYGAKSMNKFLGDNVKLIRENYLAGTRNFNENIYGNKAALGGKYKVSEGTLAAYNQSNVTFDEDSSAVKVAICIGETCTVGGIKRYLSLSSGDYLTAIALLHGSSKIALGNHEQYNTGELMISRMYVPEAADTTEITAANLNTIVDFETKNVASISLVSTGSSTATKWYLEISIPATFSKADAVAAIKSAKLNGVWARSTQFFNFIESSLDVLPSEAIETYPLGPSYVLNGGDVE